MFRVLFILSIIIFSLFSCEKPKIYPDTPQIEFISFSLHDSILALDTPGKLGILRFHFIDGDGNVGHDNEDSTDLFLQLYKKINGEFIEDTPDTNYFPPENHHIPYMEALGQNKTLEGNIEVRIDYYNIISVDTFKYHFYIIDRKNNKSNVDSTNEIIFNSK